MGATTDLAKAVHTALDNDGELADAVDLALEKDALLFGNPIKVPVSDGGSPWTAASAPSASAPSPSTMSGTWRA